MNPDPRRLIVLAEDSAELRALLATALEHVGYRVIQVATGEHLVAVVTQVERDHEPLRLIVTDVRMPAMGGLDAARALRAAGNATPVIFMSAWADAITQARARELGAVLLHKPLSIRALRQEVQKLMPIAAAE